MYLEQLPGPKANPIMGPITHAHELTYIEQQTGLEKGHIISIVDCNIEVN
jgi:hypothetical protein